MDREDEKVHPSRTLEWWSVIGFFTTQENRKQWSIKATLSEGFVNKKQIDSLCNITLFDQETNRHYISYIRVPGAPLRARQDTFDVGLNDSFIKGSYPAYEAHFRDLVRILKLILQYKLNPFHTGSHKKQQMDGFRWGLGSYGTDSSQKQGSLGQ